MNSKYFKISLTGNAYLGSLAMPRAYAPTMKLACYETQSDRWTDYGRMRWHKPRCWRIFLRSLAPKPPCTNRGVGHWQIIEIQCSKCHKVLSWHDNRPRPQEPYVCAACEWIDEFPV